MVCVYIHAVVMESLNLAFGFTQYADCNLRLRGLMEGEAMKTLFKLSLLAGTLLTAATSAYAVTPYVGNTLGTPNIATVPEPTMLGLLGIGIVVLALVRRKK